MLGKIIFFVVEVIFFVGIGVILEYKFELIERLDSRVFNILKKFSGK